MRQKGKVHEEYIVRTYCGMPEVKFVALAIIELHLSEGIRQLLSQSVSRKFCSSLATF